MQQKDIMYLIIIAGLAIGLFVVAGIAKRFYSSKWKLCYLVPIVTTIMALTLIGYDICMIGAYLGSSLILIGFFIEKCRFRRMITCIALLLCVVTACICTNSLQYRRVDYAEEFKETLAQMQAHYCLGEYKEIDWDGLYEEYLPQFEAATRAQDAVANGYTWMKLTMEFPDCHVYYDISDEELLDEVRERAFGYDYGLSLMRLEDGNIVAVNVLRDGEAWQAGIRNGTKLTTWDGTEITQAVVNANSSAEVKVCNFAVAENEAFYEALYLAGQGGETVTVTFLSEGGFEESATLHRLGSYGPRLKETMSLLNQGADIGNLQWQVVDDHTVLLRMRMQMYDTEQNFGEMSQQVREQLIAYRDAGYTRLILDCRENGGGSDEYNKAILSLLAPIGENVYAYDALFDTETLHYVTDDTTGNYITDGKEFYYGEDLWGNGEIILLVNAMTVSAGDHFTLLASAYPNVTVVGFTHSSCSAQGITGVPMTEGYLSYPIVLIANEDGSVYIDTPPSREATIPLDVRIPFDEAAVEAIFTDGRDYVLEMSLN